MEMPARRLCSAALALAAAAAFRVDAAGQAGAGRAAVTFTRDVAPIVLSRCAPCHRPGAAGPFSLLSYADVRSRARQIAAVTASRYMPPWLPEAGHGAFVGERRLSDAEIRTIGDWVDQGAPEGDAADLPPPREWPGDWQLGRPDLVVALPEPYVLRPGGPDVLRTFVIPLPVERGRFVRGIEVRPANPRVVHHATMRIDRTPASRRLDAADPAPGYEGLLSPDARYPDGHFLAWTPGQLRGLSDDGLAWRLEAGSDLVLQLHLQPSGRVETVQVSVGFHFTDTPPTRRAAIIRLSREDLQIPAGAAEHVVEDRYLLPVDVDLRELQPHAHLLARRFEAFARLPDGSVRWLLRIADWNFSWQDVYRYREPLRLPAGAELVMRVAYDNSSGNARNPFDPPRPVRWGQQTTDEMGDLFLQVLPASPGDLAALERDAGRKAAEADVAGFLRLLEGGPEDPLVHASLASAYLQLGRADRALAHLERALALDPRSAIAHHDVGTVLALAGRPRDAIARFEEAIRIDPDLVYARSSLGYLLHREGRIDEAMAHYRRVLAADPRHAAVHNNLAIALQSRGRLEEAVRHYELAARVTPPAPAHERNWGEALARLGRPAEAVAHLGRALEASPDWWPVMRGLAWILAADPDPGVRAPGEALRLAERAADLTGRRDAGVLDLLAAAHAAAGA
ncbi:MAG: tetratricopeptide repeat protein, partial [Acidimicrobiia bacterium]|nr:tetratricopeptide repeat protein [Acidimicrobiia bacterium]